LIKISITTKKQLKKSKSTRHQNYSHGQIYPQAKRRKETLRPNSPREIKFIDTKINHFCGQKHRQQNFFFYIGIRRASLFPHTQKRLKNKENKV
jgi:hypothetical protein